MRPLSSHGHPRELLKRMLRARGLSFPGDPLARHVTELHQRQEVTVALDVGGHRGEYGSMLRLHGFRNRIVSFEPMAENAAILRRHAGHDPDWVVEESAVGAQSGTAQLNLVDLGTEWASLHEPVWRGETVGRRSVPMVTVSEYVEKVLSPQDRLFLKIDTQGHELDVLRGAEKALPQIWAIQFEGSVLPTYDSSVSYTDLISHLESRGYELTGIFPVLRDEHLRLIEVDCVMTRTRRS